jgi:diguanylate cyclase (GGDEF)-like protein
VTLLFIDVVHLGDINRRFGRDLGDEALRHIVKHTRAALRPSDVLFRYGQDEFVALLNDATLEGARSLAGRILDDIRDHPLMARSGEAVRVEVRIHSLAADSASVGDHLVTARDALHRESGDPLPSTVH